MDPIRIEDFGVEEGLWAPAAADSEYEFVGYEAAWQPACAAPEGEPALA